MPSTLHKTRKSIAKKRNGQVSALHEKSRDSLRLHKAGVRDQRLEKLAAARNKREQPIVDRVAFFHDAVRENGGKTLEMDTIQQLIQTFIHQYDEEYDTLKKARRPGRPTSPKEDILKIKIASLETEVKQGFLMPDVTSEDNVQRINNWDGSWTQLTTITWIKVDTDDQSRVCEFPSKGLN